MSRHGTLLPIPEGSELADFMAKAIADWPDFQTRAGGMWPRSAWLKLVEDGLAAWYPASSSADRKLTARHYAPFPLRDGHDVP